MYYSCVLESDWGWQELIDNKPPNGIYMLEIKKSKLLKHKSI